MNGYTFARIAMFLVVAALGAWGNTWWWANSTPTQPQKWAVVVIAILFGLAIFIDRSSRLEFFSLPCVLLAIPLGVGFAEFFHILGIRGFKSVIAATLLACALPALGWLAETVRSKREKKMHKAILPETHLSETYARR